VIHQKIFRSEKLLKTSCSNIHFRFKNLIPIYLFIQKFIFHIKFISIAVGHLIYVCFFLFKKSTICILFNIGLLTNSIHANLIFKTIETFISLKRSSLLVIKRTNIWIILLQDEALTALQEATEVYVTKMFRYSLNKIKYSSFVLIS